MTENNKLLRQGEMEDPLRDGTLWYTLSLSRLLEALKFLLFINRVELIEIKYNE